MKTSTTSRARALGARRIAFYAVVVAFLAGVVGMLNMFLLVPFIGWFNAEMFGTHFVHDMLLGTLLAIAFVGLLVQLYRPLRRVGAMRASLGATAAILGFLVVLGLGVGFDLVMFGLFALPFVAGALHPAGRRVLAVGRIDRALAALVAVAAVPLAVYAAGQLSLQLTMTDEHAVVGHYIGMVLGSAGIAALGLLGSAAVGSRFPAWGAGALAVVLGLSSALYPTMPSSAGVVWGALAIAWALAFVGAYEYRRATVGRRVARPGPETTPAA